jgi:tetratricopeptide (TPR) repeat protein
MANQAGTGGRRNQFLIVVAVLSVAVIAATCIWFNLPARQDSVQLKNVGLGALENQKLEEATKAFELLKSQVPYDPLPVRNLAVASVVAMGDEGKVIPTDQQVADARQQLQEVKQREGETLDYRWLALHVALMGGEREEAEEDIAAILKVNPQDAAAWYARYRAYQIGFPEKLDPQALQAIEEACRLNPENAWLRVEWLRAITQRLRTEASPDIDKADIAEQLAATAKTIEPFAYVIKVHTREDVYALIEKAQEAMSKDDFDGAFGPLFGLSNVLAPHANPDLRLARRHPLEFVLADFQPAFYQTRRPEAEDRSPAIAVQFHSSPVSLEKAKDQAFEPFDFELVDFNLDGWLDIVAIGSAGVVVWSRSSPQEPWSPIASAEVQGFSHVLAQDFDADFDETRRALDPDGAFRKRNQIARKDNVCPTSDADLVLYGPRGVLLLENRYDAATKQRKLVPVASDGLPGELQNVTAATAVDLEADGYLDLLLADDSGLHFWSFTSPWKFADISSRSTRPTSRKVTQLLAVDWDRDVDLDVLVASPDGAGYLENLRHGQFRWQAFDDDFASLASAQALEVVEADGNASWDLVAAGHGGLLLLTTSTPESGVIRRAADEVLSNTPAEDVLAWDYDNDGQDDLLSWSEAGLQVLRGSGSKFAPTTLSGDAQVAVKKTLTGDLDNDGDIDAVALGEKGLTLWTNDGGNANHWLNVALQAQQDKNEEKAPSGRVAPWGTGSLLELKLGRRYQAQLVRGQSTHFGLGQAAQADVVRVVWINGVPQNILQPQANLFVCEQQTLNTSCPYLYTWDGEKFVFATDLLWNSPLGLQLADGVLAQPRPWEYLKVPGEQLVVKDGHYELQLTEELWEAAYFDQVRLIAIDHPAGASVYSNEKVGPAEISEYKVHTVRHPLSLRSAKNHRGRDLTAEIAAADGVYARVHDKKLRQGVTEPSYMELDLGDVQGKQITLFLTGWIYPSSTSINVALSHGGEISPPKPPSLSVPDGQGDWKEVLPFMGFPGGKTKTIAVDLTGLLAENDGRVRIATTMELYWDHIFYSVDEPTIDVRTTDLPLANADLHDRGYSRVIPGENHGPEQYLYHEVSTMPKWPTMPGSFTPLGNVLPLLKQRDDRLLVIGAGDEVTLRFKAPDRPLPQGWKRDFFFYSYGWEKDCNLLTVLGETADTLPFSAMRSYPWPADQQAPKRLDPLTRRQAPAFWKAIQRW